MKKRSLLLLISALVLNMNMPVNIKALEKNINKEVQTFDFVYYFNNGIARIEKDGKYGFLDKEGNLIIEPTYDYASDFDIKGEYAKVVKNNETFYINEKEERIDESKIKKKRRLSGEEHIEFMYKNSERIKFISPKSLDRVVVDDAGNYLTDKHTWINFEGNQYGEGIYKASSIECSKRIQELPEDRTLDDVGKVSGSILYNINGKKLSPYEYSAITNLSNMGTLYGKVYGKDEVHIIDCKKGIIGRLPYNKSEHSKEISKVFLGYTDEGMPKYKEGGRLYDSKNNDITDDFQMIDIVEGSAAIRTDNFYFATKVEDEKYNSFFGHLNDIYKEYEMFFYLDGTPISPNKYEFISSFDFNGKALGKVFNEDKIDIIDFEKGVIHSIPVKVLNTKMKGTIAADIMDGIIKVSKKGDKKGTSFLVINDKGKIIAEFTKSFGTYPFLDRNFDKTESNPLVSIGNIAGKRPDNSTLEDDVNNLKESFLDEEGYTIKRGGFLNGGGTLLRKDVKFDNEYNFVIRRDSQGFVTLGIRDWWSETFFSDNGVKMSDMSAFLEILKYYAGEDGEKIFEYINYKFLSGEKFDYRKKIQVGDTTVVFTDPISYQGRDFDCEDLDIHILSKEDSKKVDIAALDFEKIDTSKTKISDNNEIIKEELKRDSKRNAQEDWEFLNEKFEGKYELRFDKNGSLCQYISDDGEGYNRVMLRDIDVLIVGRDEGNPIINLKLWPSEVQETTTLLEKFALKIVPGFKEVVQYYAQNSKDAQAIFNFVDEHWRKNKAIDTTRIYEFGDTLIKFRREDAQNAGLEIVFLNM